MDVAGWDSFTPAQGVDTVVDAGGCDVLPVAVLEGPAKDSAFKKTTHKLESIHTDSRDDMFQAWSCTYQCAALAKNIWQSEKARSQPGVGC